MIGFDETITLVQQDAARLTDVYTCTVIHGAGWFGQSGSRTALGGDVARSAITVRIPAEALGIVMPREGDFVLRGALEHCTSPADFGHFQHFRVNYVGDNRRGNGLRHILLSSRTHSRGGNGA